LIDFYATEYRCEPCILEPLFGIVDIDESRPAHTTKDQAIEWTAVVQNPKCRSLQFVPIDKNIPFLKVDGKDPKRCDGMLYITDDQTTMLYFLELKTGKSRNRATWIKDAVAQLESTVAEFGSSKKPSFIRDKKAYICNSRHPLLREFSHEREQRFYMRTGFRLVVNHVIEVFRSDHA